MGCSQTQLATVSGTITDPSGAIVPGVEVTILNPSAQIRRSTNTDTKGEYRFAGLPGGTYTIRAEGEGFQTQIIQGIAVSAGKAVAANLWLRVGMRSEQVTVYADNAALDPTSRSSSTIADRGLIDLPLNGRDLFKTVILVPGVSPTPSSAPSLLSNGKAGQVSTAGMRPNWTNVLIDGMDANDPVFGYSPAGASGLLLGLDDFAEVRVLAQNFGPEYGTSGGGVIDATTKSGTKRFHGSSFEFHRDAALEARNYFELSEGLQGNSYAIPMKDRNLRPLAEITTFINLFLDYERGAGHRLSQRLFFRKHSPSSKGNGISADFDGVRTRFFPPTGCYSSERPESRTALS
jgi:hypothetical protein